ncbi:MAG: RES domain-containing protein [Paracoccaceae bacterium]|jgi:RES domain-containing protein
MLTGYRIVFARDVEHSLRAAQNPEGRFHHSGQPALYMSLSKSGAIAAVRYYAKADDPQRIMINLALSDANLIDIRDAKMCDALGFSQDQSTIRWQNERKAGKAASTWQVSDKVRAKGVDGMIYTSRSQPDLSHLVLFRWNPPQLSSIGRPTSIEPGAWT